MALKEIKENFIEAGTLEILRFLPGPVLKGIDLENMDINMFLAYLAKARYVEEIEQRLYANAFLEAFASDER